MRTALVTGASRGIGRAIARRLAAEGQRVIGVARSTSAAEGFPGRLIACDLSDPAAVSALAETLAHEAEIDHLVNNAGINVVQTLTGLARSDFDRVQQVNVLAPLALAQALVPGMARRRHGRIVNIASRAMLGLAAHSAYAASKAALTAMGRCWALEHARQGITVNTIAPGPIDTDLFESVMPAGDPRTAAYLARVPVGRLGRPEEIASAVAYLTGQDSGFITGQTLYLCGGLTVGLAAA
jgi:NAD(P)-dependent dehydrogenase (short-subunit alcohol dehydrogenase family)